MTRRISLFLLTLGLFVQVEAQESCNRLGRLMELVREQHLAPKKIDSSAYKSILDLYIDLVDKKSLYFTREDYKDILLVTASGNLCEFLEYTVSKTSSIVRLVPDRIERRRASNSISQNNRMYFSNKDSLVLASDKLKLEERWMDWIQYGAITRFLQDVDSLNVDEQSLSDRFQDEASRYRISSLDYAQCRYNNLMTKVSEDIHYFEFKFLEALTSYFDPHTQFLSKHDLYEMSQALSENKYSLGLSYSLNAAGELVISGIQPGGPAWFSGQLHDGDVIKSMRIADRTITEFGCSDTFELNQIIAPDKPTSVELEIFKRDGSVLALELTSAIVDNLDNVIGSHLIQGEHVYGYLHLPSFYSDFNYYGPSGCADDLSKELLFLANDKINGLIIDLRNNGGGSLAEAISMIGLFVDYGTVGILESSVGVTSLKDQHRGTIYDGPLVILVNKLSASASELFASALQDYNRAIIIGGTSFGKATTQKILNIDDLSDVKVTYGHYHRLDGTSIQGRGVIPDIMIPDRVKGFINGESDYAYHRNATKVTKKVYSREYPELPVDTLRQRSKIRVDTSGIHQISERFVAFARSQFEKDAVNISFSSMYKDQKRWRAVFDSLQIIPDTVHMPFDIESRYQNQAKNIPNLKTDTKIREAYYVLEDFLKLKE